MTYKNYYLSVGGSSASDWTYSAITTSNLLYPIEKENEFTLELTIPGYKKSEVDLEVDGDYLKVKTSKKDYGYNYLVVLNKKMDALKTQAKLELGILSLTIPKKESEKPQKIEIK